MRHKVVVSINDGILTVTVTAIDDAVSDTLKENADGRLAQLDRKIKAEQEAIVG